jgi:uncharacterized protein (DUF1778 family)
MEQEKKVKNINIRSPKRLISLARRAADILGVSYSEFIRDAIMRRAKFVIPASRLPENEEGD